MTKRYAIFSACLTYMNESGYYYRHEMKHWYDGELLSDAELFKTKEDAVNRLTELITDRVYQIIEVYVKED